MAPKLAPVKSGNPAKQVGASVAGGEGECGSKGKVPSNIEVVVEIVEDMRVAKYIPSYKREVVTAAIA